MKTIHKLAAILSSLIASVASAGDLEDAKALQQAGKFEEALPKFEAASKADPTNPDAALGLCQVLAGLGRYEEAAKSVDAARKAHPENAALPAAKGRANFLGLIKAEAADEPDNSAVEMFKDAAEKWAGEALKIDMKNVEALLLRGQLWMRDGESQRDDKARQKESFDKAKPFFDLAVAADPKSFDAAYEVANYWFLSAGLDQKNMELWAKAETAFFTATKLDPKSARAATNYAHCKAWQGEPGKEVALAYIKAADLSPDDRSLLVKAYLRMPPADRLFAFQGLSEAMPKNVQRKLFFAHALMEEKFFDKAIAVIEEAAVLEPKNGDVPLEEGDIRMAWGKIDDAIGNYQEALGLYGADVNKDTVERLGWKVGLGNKSLSADQREKLWTVMWKSCPAHATLWSDVALHYREGQVVPKDSKKAAEWYERAVAAAPEDCTIQNDVGVIYDYYLKQPDKGEPHYRKAIAIGKKEGYDWNAGKPPGVGFRDSLNNLHKLLIAQKRWKDLKEFAENDVPEDDPDRATWLKEAENQKAEKADKPEKPEDKKK